MGEGRAAELRKGRKFEGEPVGWLLGRARTEEFLVLPTIGGSVSWLSLQLS